MSSITQSLPPRVLASKPRRDYVAWGVGVFSIVLSVVAFIVTYRHNAVLTYNDAISHMEIARRVANGTNDGLAQLGAVWLPLPHVLMLPFIWIDGLYYSGIAGSIVSMATFVVATVLVYKLVAQLLRNRSLVASRWGGVAGAAVFALNINVLYMQSTPMTELPLFATLLGAVYFLVKWADDQRLGYMIASAVSGMLATLTRYESWPVMVVLFLVAVYITLRRSEPLSKRQRWLKLQDVAITYGMAVFFGIACWLLWNLVLFGDALNFRSGEYAKPSLWLTSNEPSIGNFGLSAKTFGYAFLENVPWILAAVASIGLVAFLAMERLKGRAMAVLSLLVVVPFLVCAIYTGERPLHVEQIYGDLYNTRFGLIMVLPVAVLVGYLVGVIGRFKSVAVVLAVATVLGAGALSATAAQAGDIVTFRDPASALASSGDQEDTAVEFKKLYDGGTVLMESFGNERFGFRAVPSQAHVYEGTNKQDRWKRSLADPSGMDVRWVIMRCIQGSPDKVCAAFIEHSEVFADYQLVFERPGKSAYRIYRHK